MNEFLDIWVKPFREYRLTRREKFVIGVVVPAIYIAVCIAVNLLP
jgi:hypothetical protein